MEIEEAINELKDLKDYCGNTFMIRTYEAYAQAIDKGIEALENQKSIIEELEKIQHEIMKTGKWREVSEVPNMYVINCLDIIEKRIKELKGENKSEQSDTEFNHEAFYEYLLNTINPNEMEKYRSMFLSNGEIVN